MRHVTSEAKAREKAKDLAKIASDKAEKLTLQRDKARAEKRRSGNKLAKTHAATAKLKNGGSSSATHKLPEAFRARIEAGEALQEEVDELSAEVRALRQKLDAKSLVECRIPHPSRTYFGLGLLSRVGLGLGLVFIII